MSPANQQETVQERYHCHLLPVRGGECLTLPSSQMGHRSLLTLVVRHSFQNKIVTGGHLCDAQRNERADV